MGAVSQASDGQRMNRCPGKKFREDQSALSHESIQPWKRVRRQLACAVALSPLFLAVHFAAYWMRFGGLAEAERGGSLAPLMVAALAIKLTVFGWFRIYRGWNRFVTFQDLVSVVQATSASSLLISFQDYLLFPASIVPRSVFLLDWCLTLVAVCGVRSVSRLLEERQASRGQPTNTPALIVGIGNAGEALLRAIRRNPDLQYRAVGFIANNPADVGSSISGVPVLGTIQETCRLAERYRVKEVLITDGELSGKQVREMVESGAKCKVDVKVLPSYEQLLHGSVDLRPRTVSIEDLLRREPVRLDMPQLRRWIDDRVILVTGSAGSIGSEICRQLSQFSPRRLVLVDRSENGQFFLERELRKLQPKLEIEVCLADMTDLGRMNALFHTHRPEVVFHAAAYKHVPLMESNPGEAVKNIALATGQLADLANDHDVGSFVMISTDKAVHPTSVMGTCKRVAELYIQAMAVNSSCRFVTVRFGNVLDSAGSVVPIFREQIARGGPVTVTHPEMVRYFMTIPEASQLVLQAGAMGRGGEVFVLDMGDPVRIVDLAEDMIRLSGLQVGKDVEIEFTGMRPGEKLYEQLYLDEEQHIATSHPKIRVVESQNCSWEAARQHLTKLKQVTEAPPEVILARLKAIVPEFQRELPPETPLKLFAA